MTESSYSNLADELTAMLDATIGTLDLGMRATVDKPECEWIRLVSAENCSGTYEMRLALSAGVACADVDVQISSSSVRIAYVASNVEEPRQFSLPHEVHLEDAVVKWYRRLHELWLSLPWLDQKAKKDSDLDDRGEVQSTMAQMSSNTESEEDNLDTMSKARLPGGMSPKDLWKLSGALESVSWYKLCPVTQVPVLAVGDDSKDTGFVAKLRNSFLEICNDSTPKCQRRSQSEDSCRKHNADLPFPQYVHTFHYRRSEARLGVSKTSCKAAEFPSSTKTTPQKTKTDDSKEAANACLDMTTKTKMRAQAHPFTPAAMTAPLPPSDPTPACAIPSEMSTQPVPSTGKLVSFPMMIPAPVPAPPPAHPPVLPPAPAPRTPPPADAPEFVPEAAVVQHVPWNAPYQLPLDKLIPDINSNHDSSTTEGSRSPSSNASSFDCAAQVPVSTPIFNSAQNTQGWRPSLWPLQQNEEQPIKDVIEAKNDDSICTDQIAPSLQKSADWKPTLRLREEAAGLQKQEVDVQFEQALLDRPRYW